MAVKKLLLFAGTLISLIYTYAVIMNQNLLGDMLSPLLVIILCGLIYYYFVVKQIDRVYRFFGWMLFLSVFMWFVCDLWWGIQTLILHTDPEKNFITVYGYSLTNLFLLFSIFFSGYRDIKRMHKIQVMLDITVIAIYIVAVLWLFVFDKNDEKIRLLLSDPISMASIVIDIIIYVWINMWMLSNRISIPVLHHRILVAGGFCFVITDLIYYYFYFYSEYKPNSWIDGGYMIGFGLMALAGYVKNKMANKVIVKESVKEPGSRLGEILILVVPIIIFVFKREQLKYVVFLIVVLLVYYVLINYTQKSIYQGKLLKLEKENVINLERKVKERTEDVIRILNTDYITGLNSRRFFESELCDTIKNIRHKERIALLYVDQNKSKAIKYLYGKDTADKLIKAVAAAIQQIAAGKCGIVAAYEDDVFVILLKGNAADKDALVLAKQMIECCNELFHVDNHAIRVTLNIGISCYPLDSKSSNELVRNADIAMHQARTAGFNRIQLYNEQIGKFTYSRHRIELKLKKAELDKEFSLHYQPQVYCENGELCGIETLLRWYEGDGLYISPLEFIPVAEEIGMIVPLGYWIIENAARQMEVWRAETGKTVRLSINVSSKQLVEVDFVDRLYKVLKRYQIPPEAFEIEITESQQIEGSVIILDTLNAIKRLGISIAIDDFGTGYSSLYYLKNIPADRIKIAKELIDKIETDIYSRSIIQMVISIAKVKKMKVIAEGVETKEQWDCLKDLRCDEIQGYYFSKPVSSDEIQTNWL